MSGEAYLSPPPTGTTEPAASPAFSTISSREQAERDRERLAAISSECVSVCPLLVVFAVDVDSPMTVPLEQAGRDQERLAVIDNGW